MRDLARYNSAVATTACRWDPGAGLRDRHGFRGTGKISVEGRDSSAARTRPAPGKIRSAQAQARDGRIIRAGTQTAVAKISATNWNRNVTNRCSDSRYAERAAPSRTVVADFDQPGARTGNGRGARNRRRHPRARYAQRELATSRSYGSYA